MQDLTSHGQTRARALSPQETPAPQDAEPHGDEVRIETYSLLAALLREAPNSELLEVLRAIEPPEVESLRPTALEQAWQALGAAARAAQQQDLEAEFYSLFIGIGRGELLPYGSWYISGALMDKPLAALRDELARLGLQRVDGVAEPEDHAAAICETMTLLADPEHGLPLPEQNAFFSTHAGIWLPRFFQELQQARNATFYVAVGQLGEAFIEFEKVWLELPE